MADMEHLPSTVLISAMHVTETGGKRSSIRRALRIRATHRTCAAPARWTRLRDSLATQMQKAGKSGDVVLTTLRTNWLTRQKSPRRLDDNHEHHVHDWTQQKDAPFSASSREVRMPAAALRLKYITSARQHEQITENIPCANMVMTRCNLCANPCVVTSGYEQTTDTLNPLHLFRLRVPKLFRRVWDDGLPLFLEAIRRCDSVAINLCQR